MENCNNYSKYTSLTYQDNKSNAVITRDRGHRIRKPGHNSREILSLRKSSLTTETCTVSLATDFCDTY